MRRGYANRRSARDVRVSFRAAKCWSVLRAGRRRSAGVTSAADFSMVSWLWMEERRVATLCHDRAMSAARKTSILILRSVA